jgi:hypothetical protein
MDSKTLLDALQRLNMITKVNHTVGVYAADRLPSNFNKPAAFIVHSENSDIEIGHWSAIYVPKKGPPQYFDSYGLDPLIPNHISFLKRLSKNVYINKQCFQALDSKVCGGYCLLFLAYNMGVIKKPIKLYPKDGIMNDQVVAEATSLLLNELKRLCP